MMIHERFPGVWGEYKKDNPSLVCVDCSYGPFCGGMCYDDDGMANKNGIPPCEYKQDCIPKVQYS